MKKLSLSSKSELKLSEIILGLWRLQPISAGEVTGLINYALDLGITSIDEADIYGNYKSQQYFGQALKKDPSLRQKIEIVSKCDIIIPGSKFSKTGIGFYNSSEKHILASVDQTLTDIHTDYLDLLLIHRPDMLMDPEVIDSAFQKLHKDGKVKYFGVSNFTPSQFEMLSKKMETPLITNQVEFSVLHYQPVYDGTFDNAIMHGMKPMYWSPFAGGELFTGDSAQIKAVKKELTAIGEELGGVSIDKIALAWIMKHPVQGFTIIGTSKKERIKSAVEALDISLTNEQWYRILIASQGNPMP